MEPIASDAVPMNPRVPIELWFLEEIMAKERGNAGAVLSRQRRLNPILDVLESRPFGDLAKVLRARHDNIIQQWEQFIREVLPAADKLTFAQVRDRLPETLTKLADALASATSDETRELIGQTGLHGEERFHQGYNVEELLIEYRILRRVVIEQVENALGRRTTTAEDLALSMGIDTVLQQGVVSFVEHQNASLQRANEAEAKFLSFLSHDMRGQLNGISLTMELIKQRLEGEAGFTDEVQDIRKLQDAIVSTVDGMQRLLQAERLRRGPGGQQIVPVDLHSIASAVASEFEHQAAAKKIALAIEVPPGTIVRTDREWLQIILQNLLSNAIKYSSTGTVRVTFALPSKLSVSDQGPGIADEQLPKIFEAFRRGETHGQTGIGLGLAIAAQAAKLLGAELTVTSKSGVGSTFSLSLPESAISR